MYIFTPYTSPDPVDRALGFEWKEYQSLGIDSTDGDDLLVFVTHDMGNSQVVKFTKCPRSLGNFRFRQQANGYGYSPAQAVFSVSIKAENKLLLAINEPKKSTLSVTDSIPTQPGIYNVEAWFFFTQPGQLSIRVFNTKTNQPVVMKYTKPRRRSLSAQADAFAEAKASPTRTERESPQTPDGWSERGTNLFPYRAEIMIQEGNWDSQYATRWELWQQQPDGKEKKLLETTRLVNGWER
jgi:hypothetical protein